MFRVASSGPVKCQVQTPQRSAPLVPYEPTPEAQPSTNKITPTKVIEKKNLSVTQNGEISSLTGECSAVIGPQQPIANESNAMIGPQLPQHAESSKGIGPKIPKPSLGLDYDDSDDDNEVQSSGIIQKPNTIVSDINCDTNML